MSPLLLLRAWLTSPRNLDRGRGESALFSRSRRAAPLMVLGLEALEDRLAPNDPFGTGQLAAPLVPSLEPSLVAAPGGATPLAGGPASTSSPAAPQDPASPGALPAPAPSPADSGPAPTAATPGASQPTPAQVADALFSPPLPDPLASAPFAPSPPAPTPHADSGANSGGGGGGGDGGGSSGGSAPMPDATAGGASTGAPAGASAGASTGASTAGAGAASAPTSVGGPSSPTGPAGPNSPSATPAPLLMGLTDRIAPEGASVSLALPAADLMGAPLAYAVNGLPPGLAFDASTSRIAGTIAAGASQGWEADYAVTVVATTAQGATATQALTWTVTAPPVLSPLPDQDNAPGDAVQIDVSVDNPNSAPVTYSATGLPAGVALDPSAGLITGTLTASAASAAPHSVTITASDGTNSVSQTFAWAVNDLAIAPLADQSSLTGDSVSLPVTASDAAGLPVTYSVEGLPPGLSFDAASNRIVGTLAPDADQGGPYQVTVRATDGTLSDSQTFAWDVRPAVTLEQPADQQHAVGDAVSLPLLAAGGRGAPLTYGAEGLPPGLSIDPATGNVTGTVAPDADTTAPYEVAVWATDGTSTAGQTLQWSISPAVTLAAIPDQTSAVGDVATLQLAGSQAHGLPLSYTVSGLPAGLTFDPLTNTISGSVAVSPDAVGPHQVVETASDGTSTATQTFAWNVAPLGLAGPGDVSNVEGDVVSWQLPAASATGAPLAYSAANLPPGVTIDSGTGMLTGTVSGGADVPYAASVTVTDGTNSVTRTFDWWVSSRVSFAPLGDLSNVAGDSVSLAFQAAEAGATLSYTATGLPPGLSMDASGRVSGTIGLGAASATPYAAQVTAGDGTFSTTRSFSWAVSALALPPVADQSSVVGDAVNLSAPAAYHGAAALSYDVQGLPPGLSLGPATGAVTGAVSAEADTDVPYAVTRTVSDGTNSVSQTFAWWVAPAVTLDDVPDQANVLGDGVVLALGGTAAHGGPVAYSATGLPDGLSVDAGTGNVTGTLAGDSGVFDVTVVASAGAFSASRTFAWSVAQSQPTWAGIDGPAGAAADTTTPAAPADSASATSAALAAAAAAAATNGASATALAAANSAVAAALAASAPNWSWPGSPFFAHNVREAKYRAWINVPTDASGNRNGSAAVGDVVAAEFGVGASTTWDAFFPHAEYDQLFQDRKAVANKLDPRILARLNQEWMQSYLTLGSGYTNFAPVGADVAAKWAAVPGFEWARAQTTWQELYTWSAYNRYQVLQQVSIPKLSLREQDAALLQAAVPGEDVGGFVEQWTASRQRVKKGLARQLRDTLLPRLEYATSAEIRAYAIGLNDSQQMVLRYALGQELSRLTAAPTPTTLAGRIENASQRALFALLYSELAHVPAGSAYGLQAQGDSTLDDVVREVKRNGASTLPMRLELRNFGSEQQRIAFLADTDYETFVAREQGAGQALPTAEQYYAARDRLIQAVSQALRAKTSVSLAVAPLLMEFTVRPTYRLEYPRLQSGMGIGGTPPTHGQFVLATLGVKNPGSEANQFLYNRYLRGVEKGMPVEAYYALDRYNQANMGLGYLAGWQAAQPADRELFAGALSPLERVALVNSLLLNARLLRAAGSLTLAEQARAMAVSIQTMFNRDLQATRKSDELRPVFEAASSASRGLNGLPAEQKVLFAKIPPSVRRLADSSASRAMLDHIKANPFTIKYEPGLGLKILDRSALTAMEFLAPVYRTGKRVESLVRMIWSDGEVTNSVADLAAIQGAMNGDFSGAVGTRPLTSTVGGVLFDGVLTVLTVLPVGTGSRLAIAGPRYVMPASLGFAQRQALSGLRHAGVLVASAGASSFAMAAVEVAPIDPQYKTSLRFVAGLGAGLGTGLGLARALPRVEFAVVRATQQLERATERLLAARAAGAGTSEANLALLEKQVRQAGARVRLLRRLGGQELPTAERAFDAARVKLAQVEETALAAGGAPSQREAAMSGQAVRAARADFKAAQGNLARAYDKIDVASLKRYGASILARRQTPIIHRSSIASQDIQEGAKLFGSAVRVEPLAPGQIDQFASYVYNKYGTRVLQDGPNLVEDLVRLGVPRDVAKGMRLGPKSQAEFQYFVLQNGKQPTFIIYRRGTSAYDLTHEYGHLLHFNEVGGHAGFELYSTANREQWVYNYLREFYWNKIPPKQQDHAVRYVMDSGGFAW